MVEPTVPERSFDLFHGSAKVVSVIVFVEDKDRPASRFEGLVTPPVAEDLCLTQVMPAVVLDRKAAIAIAEIGRRRPHVSGAQRHLEFGPRQPGVGDCQAKERFGRGVSPHPHQIQRFTGADDALEVRVAGYKCAKACQGAAGSGFQLTVNLECSSAPRANRASSFASTSTAAFASGTCPSSRLLPLNTSSLTIVGLASRSNYHQLTPWRHGYSAISMFLSSASSGEMISAVA